MEMTAKNITLPNLDKVPSLPGATFELLRSMNDEHLDTATLAKKIGQDPVLSARVLKVVNSPFYGVAGEVSSLPEAVMLLGFSSVRSLALAASLTGVFPMEARGAADPRRLWKHCFCCAICAQLLAPRAKVDAEAAFTAGLLHDIGKIAMLALQPALFEAILAAKSAGDIDFDTAELQVLGYTHATFGARLLERWHLPATLVRAVEFHHTPDVEPTSRLTDLINVAGHCTHAFKRQSLYQNIYSGDPSGAFLRLGLTRAECGAALESLPAQLETVSAMLS